jgi:hypothetical protein
MPYTCFSYSADLALDARNRDITQQAPHDSKICFSYYSGDISPGIRGRNPVQSVPRDGRLCFSYPASPSPDARSRNITQPPHDSKLCFSYY